jgi:hypothetical protein
MRRSPIELAGAALLALLAGCGPGTHSSEPAPERVLAVNADGRVVRQSTSYEKEATVFAAPIDRVWTALQLGYATLGIQPTVADRAAGRYGNEGFVAPRRMLDHALADYFTCGTGLGGPLLDQGRLYVYMVTTLTPAADGTTHGATHLTARLQRNEGTSAEPIRCGSTGQLEEALRLQVEKQLAAPR